MLWGLGGLPTAASPVNQKHYFIFILVFRLTYNLTPVTLSSLSYGILSTHYSRQTDLPHPHAIIL